MCRRRREALAGLWIVALAGLALAPLAIHQMSLGHAEWIGGRSLGHRLWEVGVTFVVGETGDIIARPESVLPAVVPLLACLAALLLLALRGERAERLAGGRMLAIAAATLAIPLALALLAAGKDYVLARNLLPALVPLLVAVPIGATLRGARRSGAAIASLLVLYSLGFCVWASFSPALQRPDWDAVAARLGEPEAPRAMVTWTLGHASLRYYLSTGSFQVQPADGFTWNVHEVDFVSDGPAPPVPAHLLGPRLPPGRLRAGRPPLCAALHAARSGSGAACAWPRCATRSSAFARTEFSWTGLDRGETGNTNGVILSVPSRSSEEKA